MLWLYLRRLYFISSAIAYCISPYASFYAGLSCKSSDHGCTSALSPGSSGGVRPPRATFRPSRATFRSPGRRLVRPGDVSTNVSTNAAEADERRRGGTPRGGRTPPGGRTTPGRTNAAGADVRRRGERTTPGRTNAAGVDERRRFQGQTLEGTIFTLVSRVKKKL